MINPFRKPVAYLVRHGNTDLNDTNCFRGWTDPPLNAEGEKSAEQIANFFSYEQLGRVISSDLLRAKQTADAIMGTGNVASSYVELDFNLRPWWIAAFEGQPKNKANMAKLEYYILNPDERIPDGEALNEFKNRQNKAMSAYVAYQYEGLPTVCVVHTSNITAFTQVCDAEFKHESESHDIVTPGGILAVYMDDTGLDIQPVLGAIEYEAEPQVS